jgi:uncharacterized protein
MREASAELFPTNEPIPASQMIGRQRDVKEVAMRLQNGMHLWLAGPRRTGKTSVCDAALTRCKAKGLYVAKVDLFRIADSAELAEALAVEIIKNRSAGRRLLRATRRAGEAALSAAQATASVKLGKELGDAAEIALTPGFAAQNPQKALDAALRLPDTVARADRKRLVLFFDEFQEVAAERKPYGNPDALTKRMRAIFQRSSGVSYLFAGSLEHVMRDLFGPGKRGLSGFGSFYKLGVIDDEEWRDGLVERFAADGCTITDPALGRLIELGEGHPRATMLVAQHAHLLSVQLETTEISADLVEVAFQRAIAGDRPTMEQTVEAIRRLHKQALPLARSLATGEPMPKRMHPGVRDRVLKRLERAGVAEHVARGDWRIINPLLKPYLAELSPLTSR